MKPAHFRYLVAACAAVSCISNSNAATITVTKNGDSGAGTLRQAIVDNEAAGGGNTIGFSITGAITLTSAELLITKNVTIVGPGARLLSVQRSAASGTPDFRIFNVAGQTVNVSGLTITNGRTSDTGGGISNSGGTVNLTACTISANQTIGGGQRRRHPQRVGQHDAVQLHDRQ